MTQNQELLLHAVYASVCGDVRVIGLDKRGQRCDGGGSPLRVGRHLVGA